MLQEITKFKEKPGPKCNKGTDDCRARSHPVKLPTSEKKLNKILGLGVVVNTFNPWGDRGRRISEFEASLVYRSSSHPSEYCDPL